MGLTKFTGHYCVKCQAPRADAIGAQPRCEQCGNDLKHVEVGHTPVRFAGYFFLGVLLLSVFGVIAMTLIMQVFAIIALTMVCIGAGFFALICMVINNAMMKSKIAASVPKPMY